MEPTLLLDTDDGREPAHVSDHAARRVQVDGGGRRRRPSWLALREPRLERCLWSDFVYVSAADRDEALVEVSAIADLRQQHPLAAHREDEAHEVVGIARSPLNDHESFGLHRGTELIDHFGVRWHERLSHEALAYGWGSHRHCGMSG
ncbi:hypothetical protein GCM10027446_01540 [Angustibacter peucedani]